MRLGVSAIQLWCGRPGGFIDSHSFLVHVRRSAQLGSDVIEWWGYQKQQYNWCTHQQVVKRGRRKQWLFPPASYVLLHPLWGRILRSGLVVLVILLRPGRGVFLSWLQIQCQGFCWQGLFCPSWSNQFSSAFVLWFHSAPRPGCSPHITYDLLTLCVSICSYHCGFVAAHLVISCFGDSQLLQTIWLYAHDMASISSSQTPGRWL